MAGCDGRAYAVTVLARAHTWLDRHPTAADALWAAILLGFSFSTLFGESADRGPAEVLFSIALTVPLVWRRRAPAAVFAAVMLLAAAQMAFVEDLLGADVAALVAMYTLVAHAPRRLAAIGYGLALAGSVAFALHVDDATAGWVIVWLVVAVHLTLAAALGDRMGARQREREALEQRTRLLAAERDGRAAIAAAAERARIARELHDVVAHSLSVVIAQADGGRYAAEQDPRAATAALHTISATAREALAEMRRALGVLGDRADDAPRRPQPGVGDLPALVARMREAGLIVELAEQGERRELAPAAGLTLYRVAQEALTNVLKHAGRGATATVVLGWEPSRVRLEVRDDGAGTGSPGDGDGDGESEGGGRGLAGMRERVELRGGTLSAGPDPAGGFVVRAALATQTTRASGARSPS